MLTGFGYKASDDRDNAAYCKGYIAGMLDAMNRLPSFIQNALEDMTDALDCIGREEDVRE